MDAPLDPRAAYASRLQLRRERVAALETRSRRIADLRLVCFLAIVAVAYLSFGLRWFGPGMIGVPVALFVGLVVWHDRALRAQRRAERAAAFYERGLARIEDRWIGQGEKGERFADPHHPYAADLDLFGAGSLFELLSLARTAAGEGTLAGWLKQGASAAEIRARQAGVEALRARLDLREELAVLGADVRAEIDAERLAAWGSTHVDPLPGWARPAALAAAALNLGTAAGWKWLDWGPAPFAVSLIVTALVLRALRPSIDQAVAAVSRAGTDLSLLAELVARMEREPLDGPKLQELRAALHGGGAPASEAIAGLRRRVNLHEVRANQFFAPIAYVLLWQVQTASAIAGWRRRFGPQLGGWIRAIGELEALSSLAAYAYEHPSDPFPELLDSGAVCEGEALGHPLLPAATCVRNDLDLANGKRLLLVSGSNMSGKSTFLRTVGVNTVLALAGGPVRAKRMRLAPLELGATLRIQDSLQQGASRFYAEITRLRQLLDLSGGQRPLLFLLDEILHGTNSHDRLIGAEAVIRALLDRGALGLVTTHDLALARLVEALGPLASNAHFADTVVEGKLVFDYRKQEGVVQQSNAIALMRAVGLPV